MIQLYETKRDRPIPDWEDRHLEARVNFLQASHLANEVLVSFTILDGELPEPNDNRQLPQVFIYTDDSKNGDQVGAAYTCWVNGVETGTKGMRLEACCTVFQAE